MSSNSDYAAIFKTGKVGIGTDNPFEQFQIGDRWTFHNGGTKIIGYNYHWNNGPERIKDGKVSIIQFTSGGAINFKTAPSDAAGTPISWTDVLTLKNNGQVGIGTTTVQNGYLLTIDGQVIAEEVKVQNSDQWYDFVFDDDYNLPNLSELEGFIKQNRHLPDVPTAKEVADEGINLGEMNGVLLKKVEELTLYIIKQQKEIDELKAKIEK
jgi:hypothetical protein